MITVYVIQSLSDGTWYAGTAIVASHRLKEHNDGKNRFTKGDRPWNIIYTEDIPIGVLQGYGKNILRLPQAGSFGNASSAGGSYIPFYLEWLSPVIPV